MKRQGIVYTLVIGKDPISFAGEAFVGAEKGKR
jgi:hypothetical protein